MKNTAEHRTIAVLGSTGSVGRQALDVAQRQSMKVDCITAGSNASLAEEQIRRFSPRFAAMSDKKAAAELSAAVADTPTKVLSGSDGILEAIRETSADTAVNAISGFAGLFPTVEVLKCGIDLALANKESLVAAGDIVMPLAAEKGCSILPVDSEHCAIAQCLESGTHSELRRILLTASGGPFFGYTPQRLAEVTAADALNHPTWKMGKKITIDSATLMNKGFEVIEASHLFAVGGEQIKVIIHRESIIHSMVEYADGAVIAQLSTPDMRLCVSHAVNRGARFECGLKPLDLTTIGSLTFAEPDLSTFPLLALAYKALSLGGNIPCALNAANEVAVEHFLRGEMRLPQLFETVERVTLDTPQIKSPTLGEIVASDMDARERTRLLLGGK